MTDMLASGVPSDVQLVRTLSPAEDQALLAMSVPEAVTDAVALRLAESCGLGSSSQSFVALVKSCDFVVQRNREWRLADSAKNFLQPLCREREALWATANELLLAFAAKADHDLAVPTYLADPAGRAFHLAALDPQAGLAEYADLAVASEDDPGSDTTWLANRLASSQTDLGIFPSDSAELTFLSAMSLYGAGSRAEAVKQLRPLADAAGTTMPVAVACHLVGRWDGDLRSDASYEVAVKLLRRSIRIGRELERPRHVAQAQHTLALILLINERNRADDEAFSLLESSLTTLIAEGDEFGVAKVLHTYGRALARHQTEHDAARARGMLLQSLRIGRLLGKRRHEAAVLLTLSEMVIGADPKTADDARRAALRLDPSVERSHRPQRAPRKKARSRPKPAK